MAQKKIHKQEKPNKAEPAPQVKKAKDLRASGFSLTEIAVKLNIKRKQVEELLEAAKAVLSPVVEVKKTIVPEIKESTKKGK